jgi:membrane protein DedA with SNARE-associated domain
MHKSDSEEFHLIEQRAVYPNYTRAIAGSDSIPLSLCLFLLHLVAHGCDARSILFIVGFLSSRRIIVVGLVLVVAVARLFRLLVLFFVSSRSGAQVLDLSLQ